ncbi:DinB family protein [Dyadobacter sp. MSC1_007]|uniref:DinB family protein n=1 Tax=Dyadobacter sp. MSC1_007 TaxID=2909264 RepID=UPI00202E372B|nr:DinB family protein [Dyadobacter sp. MSC1_007]
MITAKSQKLYSVIALYDMQTTYFRFVLENISDDDIHNRLDTKANHIAWLTGSLVEQRYDMARRLGADVQQQANELFRDNKGVQDGVTYPSLDVFREDWETITPILRDLLDNLDDDQLEQKIEMGPDFSMSLFELITFVSYREANIIGQIALWRRLLGYPGMRYM